MPWTSEKTTLEPSESPCFWSSVQMTRPGFSWKDSALKNVRCSRTKWFKWWIVELVRVVFLSETFYLSDPLYHQWCRHLSIPLQDFKLLPKVTEQLSADQTTLLALACLFFAPLKLFRTPCLTHRALWCRPLSTWFHENGRAGRNASDHPARNQWEPRSGGRMADLADAFAVKLVTDCFYFHFIINPLLSIYCFCSPESVEAALRPEGRCVLTLQREGSARTAAGGNMRPGSVPNGTPPNKTFWEEETTSCKNNLDPKTVYLLWIAGLKCGFLSCCEAEPTDILQFLTEIWLFFFNKTHLESWFKMWWSAGGPHSHHHHHRFVQKICSDMHECSHKHTHRRVPAMTGRTTQPSLHPAPWPPWLRTGWHFWLSPLPDPSGRRSARWQLPSGAWPRDPEHTWSVHIKKESGSTSLSYTFIHHQTAVRDSTHSWRE